MRSPRFVIPTGSLRRGKGAPGRPHRQIASGTLPVSLTATRRLQAGGSAPGLQGEKIARVPQCPSQFAGGNGRCRGVSGPTTIQAG